MVPAGSVWRWSVRWGLVTMTRPYRPGQYLRPGYPRPVIDEGREPGKRDRTARLVRVTSLLAGNPGGVRPREIAGRLRVSVRDVYPGLPPLQGEGGPPAWSEDG